MRLCCPQCGRDLSNTGTAMSCGPCSREYPLRDGIAAFRESDLVVGQDLQPEFRAILGEVEQYGWYEAVHRRLPRADRNRYRDIFDPRTADWFYLTDIRERGCALELGGGFGGLSMRLARLFERVVAVDSVWEHLEFARMLFEHERLANVVQLYAGLAELPFAQESFDLIVIGDWFEWAVSFWPGEPAYSVQSRALEKLYRLLRPGGTICIGAANRCGLGALKRKVLGKAKPGGRRHTLSGYRRLLDGAGFREVEGFAAFPSHRHPRMLVPLADPSKLAYATRLSLARRSRNLSLPDRAAHHLSSSRLLAPLACLLSESFVIAARRPAAVSASAPAASPSGPAASLPGQLRDRILGEWGGLGLSTTRPASLSFVQFSGNWERGGKVNWFVFPERSMRPALVAKIARTATDAERVRNEHEVLVSLRAMGPDIAEHVPRPLAIWEVQGHCIALQQSVSHLPLTEKLGRGAGVAAIAGAVRLCLPFVTQLALRSRKERMAQTTSTWTSALVERGLSAAESGRYPAETQDLLRALAETASRGIQEGCASFTVTHHGDMSAGDLLTDGKGGSYCVVDWEWAETEGLPFADLLYVGISASSMCDPRLVEPTVRALAGHGEVGLFGAVTEPALEYCSALGLEEEARRPLAALALLNLMLRMPDSRLSLLQLTLPSDDVPAIAAARALMKG